MAGLENAGPPPVTVIPINLPLVLTASGAEVARIDAVGPSVHVALGALGAPSFPSGKLTITSGEAFDSPQVLVAQTTPNDFARIRLTSCFHDPVDNVTGTYPDWDLAAGAGRLSVFVSEAGNVLNCTRNGNVGIGTERPASRLDVAGVATVQVLDITGGADLAEEFRLRSRSTTMPGTVLVIDQDEPETLCPSSMAYDPRVAGVVSGGGTPAAVTLAADLDGEQVVPVALAGRVQCLAEAITRPIRPGDLLCTASTPGRAMVCPPEQRSPGVVLGKALTGLDEGLGAVVALVSLQ
jgi:hypothetical protein